jgi:hypothetical protein
MGMGRRTSALAATATLSVLGLVLAQGASASVDCQYDSATHLLSVTATANHGPDSGSALIRRSGDSIEVLGASSGAPESLCAGLATVTNTDRIAIVTKGVGTVQISLAGGPFAPGATPEADASSEIEFSVAGSGVAAVQGGPAADHFRYATDAGVSGLNLNPGPSDHDVDIAIPDLRVEDVLFVADGGQGRDLIDSVGHPQLLEFAAGSAGNDTLIARGAPFGAILDGGAGRDHIVGSNAADFIAPGTGADTVSALGGGDDFEQSPDHQKDAIDCGPGHDNAGFPDSFDRLRSCERVKKKHR